MSIDTLKKAVKADKSAGAPVGEAQMVEIPKFERLLTLWKDEVSRALPKHLEKNMDRFLRIALTEFRVNPDLALCDPRSVFAAVLTAAQMGWEIGGPMGLAYLVPFKGEAQLIPGWKGYVDLVHRSGRGEVWTGAVYEGDEFNYVLGARPDLKHVPMGEDDPKLMTHTYSIGYVKDQPHPIVEVWPQLKLERHRNRYNKVGESHYSFKNWEMYCRKVALLQCVKYLPASVEMGQALSLDYAHDEGQQQGLTVKNVTEGLVFPVGNGGDKPVTAEENKPSEPVVETKADAKTPETKSEAKVVDTKADEEKKLKEQKDLEDKARAKAKADKEAKEKEAAEKKKTDEAKKAAEESAKKPSASPSPEQKKDSEVASKADEPPDWAKVAPKASAPVLDPVKVQVERTATVEQVEKAAEKSPAPVEIVPPTNFGERKQSKIQSMLGIQMPEYITRYPNEEGPSEEQMSRANEEMKLINGPTGEATVEKTVKEWMDVDVNELTQEAMDAFIQVLVKFRESRQ